MSSYFPRYKMKILSYGDIVRRKKPWKMFKIQHLNPRKARFHKIKVRRVSGIKFSSWKWNLLVALL